MLQAATTQPWQVRQVTAAHPTLEAVYREYALVVARWAARLGGGHLDPADVTQDVFLKVERELPAFRGDAKLSTWLYQITLNVVRTRRRTEAFRRLFRAPADEGLTVSDSRPLPSDELSRRETSRRLHQVLNRLNERYRQVLVLFEIEGRSGQEVADLMRAPVDNVWVWLTRARAAFAKHLERLEAEEEKGK
ncbi:MAG: RNA polymerase sigma factor [Myxococcota bacterium]